MTIRRLLLGFLTLTACVARVSPVSADDVGVTSARLLELAEGGYALEADASPALLPLLRPPVFPERFTAAPPSYRQVGITLLVRYEFGGSDVPLQSGDVLLLPWGRSAVLLTARWTDGTVQRGMFPRSPAGIRVPIEALKPVEHSALAVARRHHGAGLEGLGSLLLRVLLALGLVAASGVGWGAGRLALVFASGHALAMVALDLGVPTLPSALGGASLALGVALLARSALRRETHRVWPLVLGLGVVDGLGLAGELASSGLAPAELVPALFGAALASDAVLLALTLTLALAWAWTLAERPSLVRAVGVAVGTVAIATMVATVATGLRAGEDGGIDPADRMAAARFEFRSGAGGGGSAGGRAAAPPRRLESAAMLFLTVEPVEVRAEVLLGLRDFLEPLRIDGGPGSVVPIEVQGAIAARARKMVAETVRVVIDGREAVPLLTRTDFVTVAATGVSTRRQPEREPLDTAVLGVTLAYGVDRPPSEITAGWRVFPTATTVVPAVWTDPTGSERVELTPEEPMLRWSNDLSSYEAPPVRAVEVKPARWPLASLILVGLAASAWVGPLRLRRWRGVAWGMLAVAIVLYPFARHAVALPGLAGWAPARTETAEVLDALLTNVYRSFDLRDEEAIYDRLAVSVTGEQLSEVYLENRRALELENRGGARARVDEVEVLEVRSVRRDGEGGFRVDATWTVSGSVNHFGHVHYRQNRYDAAVHIIAVDGAWKIRQIELLDERRLL